MQNICSGQLASDHTGRRKITPKIRSTNTDINIVSLVDPEPYRALADPIQQCSLSFLLAI